MGTKRQRLIGIAFASALLGTLFGLVLVPGALQRLLPGVPAVGVGKALVGGPFTLTDHTGRRVSDADFRGRYMLVFFGFTYCPDVCPSTLQVVSEVLDRLGPKAARIQPIFITLDPERDTPEQLASYVASFHPRLIGLTGSPADIQAAAKAYRVYFQKVPDAKTPGEYTIDHTSIVYLMNPQGEYLTHFTHATPADALMQRLSQLP